MLPFIVRYVYYTTRYFNLLCLDVSFDSRNQVSDGLVLDKYKKVMAGDIFALYANGIKIDLLKRYT